MTQTQTYQKVLQQLSELPSSRMPEVQRYLDNLLQNSKKSSRSFAGIWSDMEEESFQDFLDDMKRNREAPIRE